MPKKPIRLNLGCGSNKIPSYVNIDVEKSVNPDRICDFIREPLPFKNESVDEVVLFHTIEHIQKVQHRRILLEIQRVLCKGGVFLVSYPEFSYCFDNWKNNFQGKKEFWEATLYGRQLYLSDYHVCIMHTPDFKAVLQECGFKQIEASSEPVEKYNTIVRAIKGEPFVNYETLCANDMKKTRIVEQKSRAAGRRK